MNKKQFNLIGNLEMEILDYIWARGDSDVKSIFNLISTLRKISHNTVQSTMDRLYKKNYLSRVKEGYAYTYSANIEREDLLALAVDDVVSKFSETQNPSLSLLMNLTEKTTNSDLDILEEYLVKVKKERK